MASQLPSQIRYVRLALPQAFPPTTSAPYGSWGLLIEVIPFRPITASICWFFNVTLLFGRSWAVITFGAVSTIAADQRKLVKPIAMYFLTWFCYWFHSHMILPAAYNWIKCAKVIKVK